MSPCVRLIVRISFGLDATLLAPLLRELPSSCQGRPNQASRVCLSHEAQLMSGTGTCGELHSVYPSVAPSAF
jgi:hypothetical protein